MAPDINVESWGSNIDHESTFHNQNTTTSQRVEHEVFETTTFHLRYLAFPMSRSKQTLGAYSTAFKALNDMTQPSVMTETSSFSSTQHAPYYTSIVQARHTTDTACQKGRHVPSLCSRSRSLLA